MCQANNKKRFEYLLQSIVTLIVWASFISKKNLVILMIILIIPLFSWLTFTKIKKHCFSGFLGNISQISNNLKNISADSKRNLNSQQMTLINIFCISETNKVIPI